MEQRISFGGGTERDLVAGFVGAGVVLHEDDHRIRKFVTGVQSENEAFRTELKYLESVQHAAVTRNADFQRRIEEVRRAIKP